MEIVLLCLIIVLALYFAMMLGANDLANSMGTSVGSGAISWRKGIIIAAIMELAGAVCFGHQVTDTLTTGLFTDLVLNQSATKLLLGMVAVLLVCGVGLQGVNRLGLPVATSHGIVGALLGFALGIAGTAGINWQQVSFIAVAWVITPLLAGIVAWLGIKFMEHWIDQGRLMEWLPWLTGLTLAVVGSSLLHAMGSHSDTQRWLIVALWLIGTALATSYLIPQREGIFSQLQVMSAATMAFAHGSNDVGNAIAPLFIALNAFNVLKYGHGGDLPLSSEMVSPTWLLLLGGIGIVLGLIFFGKRVLATVGQDITLITPKTGFVAELAASTTVLIGSALGIPASSTHALVGAVVGIGIAHHGSTANMAATRSQANSSASNQVLASQTVISTTISTTPILNWQLIIQILKAWLLTIPLTTITTIMLYRLLTISPSR